MLLLFSYLLLLLLLQREIKQQEAEKRAWGLWYQNAVYRYSVHLKLRGSTQIRRGRRWRSWLRHCATSRKVADSIPDEVSEIFLLISSFRPLYGPRVDPSSNRNECQEYFLRGKGGRCVRLTILPPSCADWLEIWEVQHLGTLRTCPCL
jgi:hypothetical protein